MECRRGIIFYIFPLITNCITTFDVWRELNASFGNENCEVGCSECECNIHRMMIACFVGKIFFM